MQKRQALKKKGESAAPLPYCFSLFFARLLIFFAISVPRLYGDSVNWKRDIFLANNSMVGALKYTHFEPKNILINESNFPRLVWAELLCIVLVLWLCSFKFEMWSVISRHCYNQGKHQFFSRLAQAWLLPHLLFPLLSEVRTDAIVCSDPCDSSFNYKYIINRCKSKFVYVYF